MGHAKAIAHEHVRQGRQGLGEIGVVLLLLFMEAEVLQEKDVAGLQGVHCSFYAGACALINGEHFLLKQLRQAMQHGGQSHILHHLAPGSAQVRAKDDSSPLLLKVLNGRNGGADAAVVRYPTILHGHVEVRPHKNAFAADLHVSHALLLHSSSGR